MNNSSTIKTRQLKKNLLEALEKHNGNISCACKSVKVNRDTFYYHYNKDPKFKLQADSLTDVALDFVEDQLFKKIKKGDTIAIIFYLKTKGKKRGYIEKSETDINLQNQVTTQLNDDQFNKLLLAAREAPTNTGE